MITSTGNNRVRSVSALAKKAKIRREQGLFIVEGAKMFAELPKDRLKETYVSESFLRQHGEKASELLQGICFEEVSDDVMKYMSDTQTPQGILAVAAQLSHSLVILEGGGLTTGGTNFDAKTRRNSTDLEDIFIAHIGGMDAFARALMIAADILENSDYRKMRAERYASFDAGEGKAFEDGKLTLEDLRTIALRDGEPKQISGKQELYEMIVNLHI